MLGEGVQAHRFGLHNCLLRNRDREFATVKKCSILGRSEVRRAGRLVAGLVRSGGRGVWDGGGFIHWHEMAGQSDLVKHRGNVRVGDTFMLCMYMYLSIYSDTPVESYSRYAK